MITVWWVHKFAEVIGNHSSITLIVSHLGGTKAQHKVNECNQLDRQKLFNESKRNKSLLYLPSVSNPDLVVFLNYHILNDV